MHSYGIFAIICIKPMHVFFLVVDKMVMESVVLVRGVEVRTTSEVTNTNITEKQL